MIQDRRSPANAKVEAKPVRVAIYGRVSTSDKGQEVENQLLELRRFVASQERWEIQAEYSDQESGKSGDRPHFKRLFSDAATRQFDLVLFWSLDRFTREGTLATLKYLEQLEGYGARWRSFTEPWIDSAGPFRDVVISLLASLAKQERVRISERVRAGLERAKRTGTRSGRPVGRPKRVFRRDEVVRLRDQEGLSWPEIARRLGVGQGTVLRAYRSLADPPQPFQNPIVEAL
jgi:DNA invertase Pin-like site-specific DNA recombinase